MRRVPRGNYPYTHRLSIPLPVGRALVGRFTQIQYDQLRIDLNRKEAKDDKDFEYHTFALFTPSR